MKQKKQVTMKIDSDTIDYFKEESQRVGIPYQTLINMYLTDCAVKKKRPQLSWVLEDGTEVEVRENKK